MTAQRCWFLLIVFLVVAALVLLALACFVPGALRQRLFGATAVLDEAGASAPGAGGWVERIAQVARPFARLSLPETGWEGSPLRLRFMNAGWRHGNTAALYFGAKSALALLLPGLLLACLAGVAPALLAQGTPLLALLCLCASVGYYLPNLVLRGRAAARQRIIFENLPDALDLLTVCVEAGLSLERALAKVAGEIHIKSVVLAQELQLVLMEMRAGFSKEQALRNLALRSGVEDVDALVAMLIQSERFGTSMGDSLRVYADNLRGKRRLAAEEAAAKIALKLMFPLIFCIFPTLLLVLIGPAALQIMHTLGSAMPEP